jgi:hypothetical protein
LYFTCQSVETWKCLTPGNLTVDGLSPEIQRKGSSCKTSHDTKEHIWQKNLNLKTIVFTVRSSLNNYFASSFNLLFILTLIAGRSNDMQHSVPQFSPSLFVLLGLVPWSQSKELGIFSISSRACSRLGHMQTKM